MNTAKYWIDKLHLQKHPEGGWFREIYRSGEVISKQCLPNYFKGDRNVATSIYYLLEKGDISTFHRIKSDEIWHFYTGTAALEIVMLQKGKVMKRLLGRNVEEEQQFQIVVPKNTWFAARITNSSGYVLAGCTVAPGFHFEDFEMADEKLLQEFPELKNEIQTFLR